MTTGAPDDPPRASRSGAVVMRAPAFWHRPPGLAARLLTPVGHLYAARTARRLSRGARFDPGIPVICVDTLTLGGTGKTPAVIALIDRLRARGIEPHVLVCRGRGGTTGPVRVDERRHRVAEVGDDALLLSAFASTWVAADAADAARAARDAGAGALILKGGFHDPALRHHLGVVVADALHGFGNGACLPAGPLREPLAAGLARADLLLTIGPAAAQQAFDTRWPRAPDTPPRAQGELRPLEMGMDWQGTRYLAFAGTRRPEAFFATLRGLGATVVHAEALSDRQPLTQTLLARLARDAKAHGAQLVTTEMDAVRLPGAWRSEVMTLPLRLTLTEDAALEPALDRIAPRPRR